jgi:hypothetical protein
MLKLSMSCTRFETNYSSCTGWSNEKYIVVAVEALRREEKTG